MCGTYFNGPVYTIMSVERGWCRSGPCKNLTFCYEIFRKQVVLLVSSGKNKISSFLAPLEKSFASLEKTSIARPG